MVTISSTNNSVIFTFDDNQHYLQNGTIEVPKNALALVVDDSDMVTFKKASSNDIFLSITLEELDMTKEEVISYYQANMVGAEGITSGEVQTMIDESISGKADSSAVTEEISAAVSGKADNSTVETLSGEVQTVSGQVANKADTSALTSHTSDGTVHVTSADKTAWNAKLDSSALAPYYTSTQTDSAIASAVSGKADSSAVTQEISAAVSGKADSSTVQTLSGQVIDDELVIVNGFLNVNAQLSGKADSSAVTQEITAAVSGKVDTSAIVTAITSGSTDSQVPSAKAVYDQLGGVKIVALSQSDYDALAPDYDANTLYIINS